MEYTGKFKSFYSEDLKKAVSVLEYKQEKGIPYMECSRCGQLIKRKMYVVQDDETDIEMLYLGSECIKHFK